MLDIQKKGLRAVVSWCSWLSRQSNTLKVSGSSPGEINTSCAFFFSFLGSHTIYFGAMYCVISRDLY
ncbi:hypothetical protein GGR55DRAFT_625160 [Xylaria sp. FL0064]|nr:hypothetical protein GGR55DRAFT_625160 [Xylaria sp. FL0064]